MFHAKISWKNKCYFDLIFYDFSSEAHQVKFSQHKFYKRATAKNNID